MGTLTMELGGKVNIICEKTGYHSELEFKLKVMCNVILVVHNISKLSINQEPSIKKVYNNN